jgi:hypothetical protein
MKLLSLLLAVALAAASFAVAAAPTAKPKDPTAAALEAEAVAEADLILDVPGYLAARAEQLHEAEKGSYGRIPRPELDRLRTAYATMGRLLEGRDTAQTLPTREKVELFNAQETISSILKGEFASAVICERNRSTGSNIRNTRCVKRGDREKRREDSQDYMLRNNHADPNTCVFDC